MHCVHFRFLLNPLLSSLLLYHRWIPAYESYLIKRCVKFLISRLLIAVQDSAYVTLIGWFLYIFLDTDQIKSSVDLDIHNSKVSSSVSEFNEFKPRLISPKNRFQLSAGLNHEKFNTILSETNHFWAAA